MGMDLGTESPGSSEFDVNEAQNIAARSSHQHGRVKNNKGVGPSAVIVSDSH